jgi:hypothetical protein
LQRTISDDFMQHMLDKSRPYSVIVLRLGPAKDDPDFKKIVWEHGRRNFQLRAEGKLCIVCPVRDESDVAGFGIFATDPEETKRIMDDDPGVRAGIFTYEVHPCISFPGDALG